VAVKACVAAFAAGLALGLGGAALASEMNLLYPQGYYMAYGQPADAKRLREFYWLHEIAKRRKQAPPAPADVDPLVSWN
jgi:hypothetical protein